MKEISNYITKIGNYMIIRMASVSFRLIIINYN
jgi:uncharacterized membrane protein